MVEPDDRVTVTALAETLATLAISLSHVVLSSVFWVEVNAL